MTTILIQPEPEPEPEPEPPNMSVFSRLNAVHTARTLLYKGTSPNDVVEALLDCGADLNDVDDNGNNILHLFSQWRPSCSKRTCKKIIVKINNVNERNNGGDTSGVAPHTMSLCTNNQIRWARAHMLCLVPHTRARSHATNEVAAAAAATHVQRQRRRRIMCGGNNVRRAMAHIRSQPANRR